MADQLLSKDEVREIMMAHGFNVKDGQTDLKPYVYAAAEALQRALLAKLRDQQPVLYVDADMIRLMKGLPGAVVGSPAQREGYDTPLYAAPAAQAVTAAIDKDMLKFAALAIVRRRERITLRQLLDEFRAQRAAPTTTSQEQQSGDQS